MAQLAAVMAERLPGLDASGRALMVSTLDLYETFADPAASNSLVTITSRRGIGCMLQADLVQIGDPSSTEA